MPRLLLFTALLATIALVPSAGAQSLPDWAAPAVPAPAPDPPPPLEGPPAEAVPTLPGGPTQVPIDGGLGLLALAGAGYAARKLRQRAA